MAKRNWNPCSAVNQNHVTGMIMKGDSDYRAWVAATFTARGDDAKRFTELVSEGRKAGYLSDDNTDTLLGTKNAEVVKLAAAATATRTMVLGLLQGGMEDAAKRLVEQGVVTEELFNEVSAQLATVTPRKTNRRSR